MTIIHSSSSQATIPSGSYPLHIADHMISNSHHYIKAGLESSYKAQFSLATVDYKVQIHFDGKRQFLVGKMVLGNDEFKGLASELASKSNLSIPNDVLEDYLHKHIMIGYKHEEIFSNYELMVEDMNKMPNHENVSHAISFLNSILSDCEKERRELNTPTNNIKPKTL